MATFSLGNITYPDNKQLELLAALRRHYGQKHFDDQGVPLDTPVDYTAAEIRQLFRQEVVDMMKTIYKKHVTFTHNESRPDGNLDAVED